MPLTEWYKKPTKSQTVVNILIMWFICKETMNEMTLNVWRNLHHTRQIKYI